VDLETDRRPQKDVEAKGGHVERLRRDYVQRLRKNTWRG
jgi:hypothetical protein